ncbi:hypothetical protein X975_04723, partial [Stegodyphus mimosarum]
MSLLNRNDLNSDAWAQRNKSYTCEICHKSCSGKQYLNQHMLTHMDEKVYVCDTCHKPFPKRRLYVRHIHS